MLAEPAHEVVDGPSLWKKFEPPYVLQQILARENGALGINQPRSELELKGSEPDPAGRAENSEPAAVENPHALLGSGFGTCGRLRGGPATAGKSRHSSLKLIPGK